MIYFVNDAGGQEIVQVIEELLFVKSKVLDLTKNLDMLQL